MVTINLAIIQCVSKKQFSILLFTISNFKYADKWNCILIYKVKKGEMET